MAERAKKKGGAATSQDITTALRAELADAPDDAVQRPNRDVSLYLPWAQALATAVDEHRDALLATPMEPDPDITADELATFAALIPLLASVQDEQTLRQEGTSKLTPKQLASYTAARAAEDDVVAVIRFAFRKDRKVRAWCTQVLRGDGAADLHEDVRAIEGFHAKNAAALARFPVLTKALEKLTTKAAEVPGVADPDAQENKRHTRLRNAAWTRLDAIAARLCTAGRFALRADVVEARRFRRLPEQRSAKKKAEVPNGEAGGEKKTTG